MGTVRESIDVAVPVRVAYQLLCRFEGYPQFMTAVRRVTQLSRTRARWVIELDGTEAEFDTAITERRPDEALAWHAVDGPRLAEKVTFERLTDTTTRITAERDGHTGDGHAGEPMPADAHLRELFNQQLRADLAGLKEYLEGVGRDQEP